MHACFGWLVPAGTLPEAIDSSTKHLAAAVAEQIRRPRLHVLACRLTWFSVGGFSGGIFRPLAQTLCKMPLPTRLDEISTESIGKQWS